MKNFVENIANLFKVKTLVTIAVILVFVVLALNGSIEPDNVMIIISMVVSFYFGTQHEKTGTAAPAGAQPSGETVAPDSGYIATALATVDAATYRQTHPNDSAE